MFKRKEKLTPKTSSVEEIRAAITERLTGIINKQLKKHKDLDNPYDQERIANLQNYITFIQNCNSMTEIAGVASKIIAYCNEQKKGTDPKSTHGKELLTKLKKELLPFQHQLTKYQRRNLKQEQREKEGIIPLAPSVEDIKKEIIKKLAKILKAYAKTHEESTEDEIGMTLGHIEAIEKCTSHMQLVGIVDTMIRYCADNQEKGKSELLGSVIDELLWLKPKFALYEANISDEEARLTKLLKCDDPKPIEQTKIDFNRSKHCTYLNDKKLESISQGSLAKAPDEVMENLLKEAGVNNQFIAYLLENANQHGLYLYFSLIPAEVFSNTDNRFMFKPVQTSTQYFFMDLSTLTWQQLHNIVNTFGVEKTASSLGFSEKELRSHLLNNINMDAEAFCNLSDAQVAQIAIDLNENRAFVNKDNLHFRCELVVQLYDQEEVNIPFSPFRIAMDVDLHIGDKNTVLVQKINVSIPEEDLDNLKKNTAYLDPDVKKQLNAILQKIRDKPDVLLTELQQRQKLNDGMGSGLHT
ncbi:TPA: hypothetical protein ACTXXA_001080 [Legionella anisa]